MAVLNGLRNAALVHIASPGCGAQIVLALKRKSSSRVSWKNDYVLTVKEVLKVRTKVQLVVLKFFGGGRGNIDAVEGVIGFARAFLAAGAPSVMVTL